MLNLLPNKDKLLFFFSKSFVIVMQINQVPDLIILCKPLKLWCIVKASEKVTL